MYSGRKKSVIHNVFLFWISPPSYFFRSWSPSYCVQHAYTLNLKKETSSSTSSSTWSRGQMMSKGGWTGINKCNANVLTFLNEHHIWWFNLQAFFPSQYGFRCPRTLHRVYDFNSVVMELAFLLFTSSFKEHAVCTNK